MRLKAFLFLPAGDWLLQELLLKRLFPSLNSSLLLLSMSWSYSRGSISGLSSHMCYLSKINFETALLIWLHMPITHRVGKKNLFSRICFFGQTFFFFLRVHLYVCMRSIRRRDPEIVFSKLCSWGTL